jgi:hypothetical protein
MDSGNSAQCESASIRIVDIAANIGHYFAQYHSFAAIHAALHRIIMHQLGAKVNAFKRSEV